MNAALLFSIKLALLPVLLWQGRQVRRRALRLPEAQGPREGVAGSGPVCLRVLIVGDSSAAGVGAENQTQALAGRLSDALASRLDGAVTWQLVAHTGDTTQDAVKSLHTQRLHPADVMVTALGVNDVVSQVPATLWLKRLGQLGRVASTRAGVRFVVHSAVPPMEALSLLPNPLRWVLGADARRLNAALRAWVGQSKGRWWLPFPRENQPVSDSVLMAEDGFHPSPAMYALWAEQLAGLVVTEIVPRLERTTPTRRPGA